METIVAASSASDRLSILKVGNGAFHYCFAVPDKNMFAIYNNRATQESVMLKDEVAIVILCKRFVFQPALFIQCCLSAKQGFVASGKSAHLGQLLRRNPFLFNVLQRKAFGIGKGFQYAPAGIAGL